MSAARFRLSLGRAHQGRPENLLFQSPAAIQPDPMPLLNVDDYFSLGGSRCNSLISEIGASQVETAWVYSGQKFSRFDQLRRYLQDFSMMLTVLAG
jgi:hypothetical protein